MSKPAEVDTAKLLELRHVNGLTYQEIADMLGTTASNVYSRLKRLEAILPDAGEVEIFRTRRADILSGIQTGLLAHIGECLTNEEQRSKISPYQAAGMFGLIYDKERLETGKSSANIAVLSRVIEVAQERGDEALRKSSIEPVKPKLSNSSEE